MHNPSEPLAAILGPVADPTLDLDVIVAVAHWIEVARGAELTINESSAVKSAYHVALAHGATPAALHTELIRRGFSPLTTFEGALLVPQRV